MDVCRAAGSRRAAPIARDPVGLHQGRIPRNKGLRHPPDPPTVEEVIAVMRAAGDAPEGMRLRRGDHRALACRASDKRGACAGRDRS
jgi:hypothetical protein